MIHTLTLYHPLRPVCCLEQALDSLKHCGHHQVVEVVVQGDLRADVKLPEPEAYKEHDIELRYIYNDRNQGNSVPVRASIERFLASDAQWFCKWDDDMSGPHDFQSKLIHAILHATGKGHKVGAAMIAPPQYLFSGQPRMKTVVNGNSLRWQVGEIETYKTPDSEYAVCDFADHGATIFARSVFEDGVRPDTNLFVGGVDFDMALQMLANGYSSILMTNPRCDHHHEQCKPYDYGRIRYSYKQIQRSASYLERKWGLEMYYLKKFKGGPWKNQRPKRPEEPNWHRAAVAGKRWKEEGVWDSIGKLQLTFLQKRGLTRGMTLLDFGCGAGRFGVHAARWLNTGGYYGVDKEADLITAFREVEAPRFKVSPGKLNLFAINDFDLSVLPKGKLFDMAMAHSIVTHLTLKDSLRLVRVVMKRMKPNGSFYVTFHESKAGAIDESEEPKGFQAWRQNERLLTVYPYEEMVKIAENVGCFVSYIGEWGHKYNKMNRQMMVRFYWGQRE